MSAPSLNTCPDGDIIITVFPGHPTMETEVYVEQGEHAITERDITFNTDAGELIITDEAARHYDLSLILQAS